VTAFKHLILTTALLVIGIFSAQAQYTPPAAAPPPANAAAATPTEIQQLQLQIQDLQNKLNAVSNNVSQEAGQIAPMKDKLDKTVQETTTLADSLKVAQSTADKKYSDVKDATDLSINISWTLITGFLVMFMQAGFAMVETGFTRAKNVAHTMMMNFMVYSLGMLGFWVCGFAFQFGGTGGDLSVSTVSSLGPNRSEFGTWL